jgi:uncharacterized protein YndB with AHSA1/START domain
VSAILYTIDGLPALRFERRLAHPPEKVWRAITEPEHLSRWYPFRVTAMDLRVGGTIHFDDGTMTMDAVITQLDPPRRFAFSERAPAQLARESEDLVSFELRADGDGCLLIFTHVFHDRPAAASYASGWDFCLDALASTLDGKPVEPPTDMAERHEAYVSKLGLDEGSSEETADGWRVRFERQLTRPVDAVWAALSGSVTPAVGSPAPAGLPETGPVTAVEAPTLLEYRSGSGGRIRWELSPGTGHGARLVLTRTGVPDPKAALTAWRDRVEQFAERLT